MEMAIVCGLVIVIVIGVLVVLVVVTEEQARRKEAEAFERRHKGFVSREGKEPSPLEVLQHRTRRLDEPDFLHGVKKR